MMHLAVLVLVLLQRQAGTAIGLMMVRADWTRSIPPKEEERNARGKTSLHVYSSQLKT